jgi:hypothetical protein
MDKSNFGEVGFSQANPLENGILAFDPLLNFGIQVNPPHISGGGCPVQECGAVSVAHGEISGGW